jgi:predicted dehydrogenase
VRCRLANGIAQPISRGKVAVQYPAAKRYDDYRIMLEEMSKSIDAVVITTADHSHAHASILAMSMKKHVYCEKPLAHDMHEVRAMMAAAQKYKVITQTGNQGHSNYDVRSMVEWVRAGAIGSVKEVHLFEGPATPGVSTKVRGGFKSAI